MLRIPVKNKVTALNWPWKRTYSSSKIIRTTFIDYFSETHDHKHIKSSPVVPLCDPTVPFVNAGMNQFKGVFHGKVQPPCPRAVNSQKCVRVGGKHNDLDVVGTDGHHHTFFEMLGSWSFGDYYKKEACQMAWDLLLGPYRLKPENLVVTYFEGDVILGLTEDRECRDVWRDIGVKPDRIKALGAKDNFWEMGVTGPCGPCTEIHYVNPDGSLTEIWNIVFIQFNRESDGRVTSLGCSHVDTGMGLERVTALLQGVPTNYDTDLFVPIIRVIEQLGRGVSPYSGSFGDARLDSAYRRLADHARMVSVCLADQAYPVTSLNLKQIMRRSFKISSDIFNCPKGMLSHLYDQVAESLGSTYPELETRRKESKIILEHEEAAYAQFRGNMARKWKELVSVHPEVEELSDVEMAGFVLGYREFKETMTKQKTTTIPGELVFQLYDRHGFQEDIIDRIADINGLTVDKQGFRKLLEQYKNRHKAYFKEQNDNKSLTFEKAIDKLVKSGIKKTNDEHKYDYSLKGNKIHFEPLKTKMSAMLNQDGEWIDFLEPSETLPYYLVTEDSNFYCEEGGQSADIGIVKFKNGIEFKVETVFKIRDFIIHKGVFKVPSICVKKYVSVNSDVILEIDSEKRLKTMSNHTGVHLLNAAIRKVLPNSVLSQIGSKVTERGLVLNLAVYGEKVSQKVILDAQRFIRRAISSNIETNLSILDSVQLNKLDNVLTVPGETYPEVGLRLVQLEGADLVSRELCCGTHLPSTGFIEDFCITLVRRINSNAPGIHAVTGEVAKEARELFCRAQKLHQVIDLTDPERLKKEAKYIRNKLTSLCGTSGAPVAEYAECLALLDKMKKMAACNEEVSLVSIAQAEISEQNLEASQQSRPYMVHFLRCSYLMSEGSVQEALRKTSTDRPALVLACASGIIHVTAVVPQHCVTSEMTASKWLGCVLPVFNSKMVTREHVSVDNYAEMTPTKVSLINCEQLVQDTMRAAIKYASHHTKTSNRVVQPTAAKNDVEQDTPSQDRRTN